METGTKYMRLKVEKKTKEIRNLGICDFNASDLIRIIDDRAWNSGIWNIVQRIIEIS